MRILQRSQPLPQTSKGRFLLAKHGQGRGPSLDPMQGLSAYRRQRGKLCYLHRRGLEEPVCAIPGRRHSERYKLKRLAMRYFLHDRVFFKKGYDGDPLRCLGPKEAREMIKEVHAGECGEHQRKKKLYKCLL